jgi:hypothetical protein
MRTPDPITDIGHLACAAKANGADEFSGTGQQNGKDVLIGAGAALNPVPRCRLIHGLAHAGRPLHCFRIVDQQPRDVGCVFRFQQPQPQTLGAKIGVGIDEDAPKLA